MFSSSVCTLTGYSSATGLAPAAGSDDSVKGQSKRIHRPDTSDIDGVKSVKRVRASANTS